MIRFSGISKELEAQVLRWQHELHTIPEVGFQEFETTEYLKKCWRAWTACRSVSRRQPDWLLS